MVASGQVQSYFGEFLCDVVDGILHPREGPSGRELAKNGYELFTRKGNRLNVTEIWVTSKDGKVIDIRVIDYSAGGLFRDSKYGTKFASMDDVRDFFAKHGVNDKQFAGLESGIKLWKRQTVFHDREIVGWSHWFHESYTNVVREPYYDIYS